MKITCEYKGDNQTELTHAGSGSKIMTDLPQDNGGKGRDFSPTDIFAGSFGACVLAIMSKLADRKGDDLKGMTIEVDKIMTDAPRRVGKFVLNITFPADLTDQQKKMYLECVKSCPVHNSLSKDIIIEINHN
ncbi:putative OsmC-related protein [Parelusimicrobium proximum]|uniref:OsmC family protein n=1 Tax=Parelusimicrobium proximum TaxID=3228953 RepID=UPI003D166A80